MTIQLARPELLQVRNFIAGEWRDARSGQRFAVTDPATGAPVAEVADSDAADARAATDAAHAAFATWRRVPPRQRSLLLRRWHALVMANARDLSRLISIEQGKVPAEADGEVLYAAGYIEWFAEEAVRADGEILASPSPARRLMVLKEPIGVVAAITPWNFPLAMIARKIAPALAAGCTVVAKPAEDTPLTALALVKLLEEAGLPPGVLNIVCASRERGQQAAADWLADGRVRKVTFTGSTAVGKFLARESAATLKKLSLELGGNAPFIVFDDADVDAAVKGLLAAKFRNVGQACVSPNRVYVQAGIYDEFATRVAARVAALKVGPHTHRGAQVGPLINGKAVEKVERHVGDAVARGARVLVGGARVRNEVADGPNYFAPTVLADVPAGAVLSCEETFGPVVALFRFDTEAEVIGLANDSPFGLAAYFYSRDVKRIWRVAGALESGMVGINEGLIGSEIAPFGGIKESGYGREGSRHGLDDYMATKYLCQGELD